MRSAFHETLDAVYAAAVDERLWPAALESLSDHVGAAGALIAHNPIDGSKGAIVVGRLRDDLSHLYVDQYCDNPLVLAMARHARIGEAYYSHALIDPQTVRRTAWHADILAPQQIAAQITVAHRAFSGSTMSGGFGFTLDQRQADDWAPIHGRVRRLIPHISRALDLTLQAERRGQALRGMTALLDAFDTAAVLLDAQAHLAHANAAAEALLARHDMLGTTAGRTLSSPVPSEDRRLAQAIAQALRATHDDAPVLRDSIVLRRPSGLPALRLVFVPLPPSVFAFRELVTPDVRLLVQIIDPARRQAIREGEMRAGYGLTPSEARVAALIAAGLSTPQAASALGLSANTVRTHLAHCFDKTGVRSQAELILLVTAFAQGSG